MPRTFGLDHHNTFDDGGGIVAADILLKRTYSVAGGELATPIREFQDAAGITWFETIFVKGHEETLERHSKPTFLDLVLQEFFDE